MKGALTTEGALFMRVTQLLFFIAKCPHINFFHSTFPKAVMQNLKTVKAKK
jgi:hypothetical protein